MAEDMIDRAVRAGLEASIVGIAQKLDDAIATGDFPEKIKQQVRRDSARNYEKSRKEAEPIIRAALLAALDLTDGEVLDIIRDCDVGLDHVCEVIEVLKARAQGEQS